MAQRFMALYNGVWNLVMEAPAPTREELMSFESDSPLEIRFIDVDNVLFFSIKFAGERPYDTPLIIKPEHRFTAPDTRSGYMLLYTLIPAGHTRMIGLGHDFSVALYNTVKDKRPYGMARYAEIIDGVNARYTQEQLWELAPPNQRYVVGTPDAHKKVAHIPDDITLDDLIAARAEYVAESDTMSIYCVLESMREEAQSNPDDYIVPVPISYIRDKGFCVDNNVVYVDAPYGTYGLDIDDKYYGRGNTL